MTKGLSTADICKQYGINLTLLVEMSGISRQTLSNWMPDREKAIVLLIRGVLATNLASNITENKRD